ncbi:unnamed protein product [Ilex paraguariensis]|uniref:Uncharacterized protein n=1 Tax=Ilex paraguariensis TaxID=185542 RepID=A0ABC8S6D4_9AQUA
MTTLVRNTTRHFSRRCEGYGPLDHSAEANPEYGHGRRTFSRRKSSTEHPNKMTSLSYRRDRARKRHIFLQTYKLAYMDSSGKSRSRKLKKLAVKLKSAVVSVVSFIRLNSLRTFNYRSAICASSPSSIRNCF